MREILFRGKTYSDEEISGEWIYGDLEQYEDQVRIRNKVDQESGGYLLFSVKVIPETIGQYTGLKDKNGEKIFEGDILRSYQFIDQARGIHYLYHIVEWSDSLSGWRAIDTREINIEQKTGSPILTVYTHYNTYANGIVIGNTYDNPELWI